MQDPQITWYTMNNEGSLVPNEEFYAGSYRPTDMLEVRLQVWNNRWGQEKVADAISCKVVVYFDHVEESALLDYCKIKVGEKDFVQPEKIGNKGQINLDRTLSGIKNNGTMSNISNFETVVFRFGPITDGMKEGLKNLYFDLEYDIAE